MCFVTVPHPIGMLPKAEVDAKIDAAFDDIAKAATQWKAAKGAAAEKVTPYPAKRFKFTGTDAEVNDLFARRKWSLSLPIVPPTPQRVAAMLKGTKRNPAEVVWVVPPRQGMLTVELVATLGVMAGAKPEHMPLLLATIEAFKNDNISWRGVSTTTAATVPVIIISGPVIEKLGLNPGTGVAGPENPVTNALGYFINLVGDVVGGSVPPNLDKSTHGSSGDFVAMVFTENEKANPWKKTYAQEEGFQPTDSVVTVFGSYLGGANVDHDSHTGQALLTTLSLTLLGNAAGPATCLADPTKPYDNEKNGVFFSFIFLCPEHADLIQRDFPDMNMAKKFVIETAKMPLKFYSRCAAPEGSTPETLLPRFVRPESIHFVVTGGAGKQSQVWSPFPQSIKPVSVKIDMN